MVFPVPVLVLLSVLIVPLSFFRLARVFGGREIREARACRTLLTLPVQLDGVPMQKPGSRGCAKLILIFVHIQFFPLYRFRGEATGLHPIQRKTAGKVAGNLVGNGVAEAVTE